jgi:hypothetical protein
LLVAAVTPSSDRYRDISRPSLLEVTTAMGTVTSAARYYYRPQ